MKIKSKVEESYYEIKKICKTLKEKSQKLRIKDNERFEDVPKHISDRDKEGRIFHNSYMDFYLSVKYDFDQALLTQPSGVTATNKNYDYANAKFIQQLDKENYEHSRNRNRKTNSVSQ